MSGALPGRRRAPTEEAATRRRPKTRQPLPRCRHDPAGAVPVSLTATSAAWAKLLTDNSLSQAITP
ncbi:hypothetical protein WJ438_38090 [Streptomyces sp. GD-15H]|uniref:hypothetical protein n=1 Tax=Streptomyces sp. GD-15H TaxID=3129112 RepID=UPI0032448401